MRKSDKFSKNSKQISENQQKFSFSALNPYETTNLVLPTERKAYGGTRVQWGDGDIYPSYLYGLYESCSTLHSIISSIVDYVAGDDIETSMLQLDEVKEQLVRDMAFSLAMYGGYALEVVRNNQGGIAMISCLDMRCVRTNEECTTFYYSEKFKDKLCTRGEAVVIPAFNREDLTQPRGIYYYKNNRYSVYPSSPFGSAAIYAEIDKSIGEFQLNQTKTGFVGDYIISFNSGIPSDELKFELETAFDEKYCGTANAGRPMLVFSQDKEHGVTVEKIGQEKGFLERFDSTSDRAKQELFSCYRMNPMLAGINAENTGFSTDEFKHCFSLFNRTQIKPLQNAITKAIGYILSDDEALKITPFTINFD